MRPHWRCGSARGDWKLREVRCRRSSNDRFAVFGRLAAQGGRWFNRTHGIGIMKKGIRGDIDSVRQCRIDFVVALVGLMLAAKTAASSKPGQRPTATTPVRIRKIAGSVPAVTLASAVQRTIREHFPGYHLANFGDFQPLNSSLRERDLEPFVPFACTGDFDGNGLPDAGLLLKNSRRQWLLVALHQSRPGTFRAYRIAPRRSSDRSPFDTPGKLYFFIEALPLRKYFPGLIRPGRRGHRDGIHAVWVEEASTLFYFSGGHYRSLQTSD